jgi:choline dehydrogenase-like flavoprotein
MVYMREQKKDYDGWAAHLGNDADWSCSDMLPHFTKACTMRLPRSLAARPPPC